MLLSGSAASDDEKVGPSDGPLSPSFVELQTPSSSASSSARSSTPVQPSSSSWFGAASVSDVDASYVSKRRAAADDADVFDADKHRIGQVSYLFGPGSAKYDDMFKASDAAADGAPNDGDANHSSEPGVHVPNEEPVPWVAHAKLGQWPATAICGNDITSSSFYVTGIAVSSGGVWAPICMVLVAATLRLFVSIYGEAVTALPLNGGAYNVLLNTTNKKMAAVAACLSILSYMATAVVSASSAIAYLQYIYPGTITTLGVLLLLVGFAALTLWGITDSARVALCIFAFHITTLTILVLASIVWLGRNGAVAFSHNIDIYASAYNPPPVQALVFGFASSTLGVSGFETSANFVEEQAKGVFVKTLRNMWVAVALYNIVFAVLAVLTFPVEYIADPNNIGVTLALMAENSGGDWLKYLVCIDAFLVLSGAVLTGFVGVTGLARRLAMDGCLPQLALTTNRWRGTNHVLILSFLAICASLYGALNGNVSSLANVYSVSFLCVMALFSVACMLLKYKRSYLPREVTASWAACMGGLALVLIALVGVIINNTSVLSVWLLYIVIVAGCFSVMFLRGRVLRLLYHSLRATCRRMQKVCAAVGLRDAGERWFAEGPALNAILRLYHALASQSVVFFEASGELESMNKAVLYCRANEETQHIRVVHIYNTQEDIPPRILRNVSVLDEEYPRMKVDLVLVQGAFSPEMVDYLAGQLGVRRNLMFMSCPKRDFKHKVETLGGVRIISK